VYKKIVKSYTRLSQTCQTLFVLVQPRTFSGWCFAAEDNCSRTRSRPATPSTNSSGSTASARPRQERGCVRPLQAAWWTPLRLAWLWALTAHTRKHLVQCINSHSPANQRSSQYCFGNATVRRRHFSGIDTTFVSQCSSTSMSYLCLSFTVLLFC